MNIKTIITKVSLLAAAALMSTACLEKLPGDFILWEDAMQTISDARQTRTGIYSTMKNPALFSGALTLAPDIQTDLVYAVEGNSNVYGDIWQWKTLSTTSEVEAVYAGLYQLIGRCNFYLDKVDQVKDNTFVDEELDELDQYTGEVKGIRAFAYSELLKMYCKAYKPETAADELGVVIRTRYFVKEPVKRASLKDSYDFVIKELEEAEKLLDEDQDRFDKVSFTQAAVRALHARVSLYMRDWDNAIKYSTYLIDSKNFMLSSVNETRVPQGNFDYMWTNDSSVEVIFKVGFTPTSMGGSLGSIFLNFPNDFTFFYPDYVPAQSALRLFGASDLRYQSYFEELQTGYPHQLKWPLLIKYFGNEAFVAQHIFHVNMPKPFRLAEQYLIRAEAYCNKGWYSQANTDLSTLSKSRHSNGGAVAVNSENWLDIISDERAKELYMEGFRLNDLKRWERGFERQMQANVQKSGATLKISADNPLFVWPIPKHELESPGSEILPNESNK